MYPTCWVLGFKRSQPSVAHTQLSVPPISLGREGHIPKQSAYQALGPPVSLRVVAASATLIQHAADPHGGMLTVWYCAFQIASMITDIYPSLENTS